MGSILKSSTTGGLSILRSNNGGIGMRQIAIYGKGGIGKSMVSSHISFALSIKGLRVLHVGCDPKHDSTRLLLKGTMPETILETLRDKDFDIKSISMDEVIFESAFNNECEGEIYCAESGGPDPGASKQHRSSKPSQQLSCEPAIRRHHRCRRDRQLLRRWRSCECGRISN